MFCPKCGNNLSDGAKFCPKCGTPLQAAGNQSNQSPPQPTVSKNTLAQAGSAASPIQKKARKVHLCILLVNLILAGLWFADTIVMIDQTDETWSALYSLSYFCREYQGVLIFTCVLALLSPVISNLFLTRHMLKKDGKVNASPLLWVYWIWTAGFYAVCLAIGINTVSNDELLSVVPTTLGWVYIICCAALLTLLVYLTVLHFKAAKESKAVQKF